MKYLFTYYFMFLFLSSLMAQSVGKEANSTLIPLDPDVKIGKLENGLTYYIKQNAKPEDKLELRLIVKIGAINEDNDQLGLAHIMEHMNFNGTKNFKKNDLIDYLQSIGVKFGADLNAYTNQNETVYKLSIPTEDPKKITKGFLILEDWAHNTLLESEAIDDERGIVLEEYRKRLGANQRIRAQWLPLFLKGSKYAERNVIGTKESITNFSHQRIRDFYKDWYRPDLMSVVAVGDLDIIEIEQKIIQHFSKLTNPTTPRIKEKYSIPKHDDTKIAVLTDSELETSSISLVYKDTILSQPVTTIAQARAKIIQNLFSRMVNIRLQDLAYGETPPFANAYAGRSSYFAPNLYSYYCGARMDDSQISSALEALFTENERIKRHGFLASELNRVKKILLSLSEKSAKETGKKYSKSYTKSLTSAALNGFTLTSATWKHKFYKTQLPTITLEEVNALMPKYLHKNDANILITSPEKAKPRLPTATSIRALLKEIETKTIPQLKEAQLSNQLITKLPKKGQIVNSTKDTLFDITTLELSNGAKVLYKKTNFKNDEIILQGFSYGGYSLYSDADYKNTYFARLGLKEAGFGGFSDNDLNKMLAGKLARVNTNITSYKEHLNGSSAPKDLKTLFELVHLNFTSLNKNEKAYEAFKTKYKNIVIKQLASPYRFFNYKVEEFLEGDHPRYMPFPTAESIDASDYPLAWRKFGERFDNAGDFTFIFVGNIDDAELKEYIETYIASLPATKEKENYKLGDYRPKNTKKELIVRKGLDQKSQIKILFRGEAETYDQKEKRALQYLGAILKIKLIEKLREEQSSIYSSRVTAGMRRIPYPEYYLNIDFGCAPEKVKELKMAALEELQKILDHGPEQKDLNKVIEKKLLERKEREQSNNYWAKKIYNAAFWKTKLNATDKTIELIKSITTDDIKNIGNKYLKDTPITMMLLPEENVENTTKQTIKEPVKN